MPLLGGLPPDGHTCAHCAFPQECHIHVSEEAIRKLMLAEGCVESSKAGVIMRAETFKRCLLHGIAAQGPEAVSSSASCSRTSTFEKDSCPVSPTARAH